MNGSSTPPRDESAPGARTSTAAEIFSGPGEMRALCREMDWSTTPFGPVEGWSHSLRTTVRTLLASRNPMFLWWGPELAQIYNDAYRPSLGAGDRHPAALGARGREFWTDIWEAIGPQIDQVMTTGEPTWHDDQYLPIERNGGLEDVWWTYGYSPVWDDDGRIGGTLVVCQETTNRIMMERERDRLREESARADRRAAHVLSQVADEHLTLDSEYRILAVNAAAQRSLGMTEEEMRGRVHWEVFPGSLGTVIEREYRRVVEEGAEVHFTHHYVADGYDRHVEVDGYPTDDGGAAIFARDVTDRVRALAALRESEARLRAIYDGTFEYMGLVAPDGTVLDCNRAALQFARSTREEVVGRPVWEGPWFAYTPGAPERVREGVTLAAAGEFVRHEIQLLRPSGESITLDFSLYPVRGERGEVVFIVPEGRDITAHLRAREAVRESDARYRTLFDSLDQGFCVLEVLFDDSGRPYDYRFLEANPSFEAQTGLVGAVGRTAREMVPDLEEHWFEMYGRVATTGEAVRFESGSDPMGRWFDVYAFRAGAPEERKVALLFKDVTTDRAAAAERERLLGALELERTRLAQVFQRAPSFIVAFRGADQTYEFVNEAYYQLVGYRDIIGKPLLEALPEIRDQGFKEILDGVRETGEPWVGRETPVVLQRTPHADLETRYLDMVFQPLVEAGGSRSGVVVHGSDVTEHVLARREVERLLAESEQARAEADHARADAETARAEAEAANRAKSEFLAIMSHELRTPLNAIGGYSELMEMGIRGPISEQMRDDLRRIQTSQRHLLGLINEVLNYARLETGTVHFEKEDIPVREVLIGAEALVSPQARAKGLALHVEECPPDATARGDAEKMRQILVNLLSNAVKFTDPGGRIDVSEVCEGEWVIISVRDTGIGIPADKIGAIFDPFVQVRSDLARPNEGTGLGLAISRDLARGMGGDLTAESTVGAGSTFTLTLPAA